MSNKIVCPECGTHHQYRGASPDSCDKCGKALDRIEVRGFTTSRKPGQRVFLEDVDEDGNIIRAEIVVLSTSAGGVRLNIVAPDEVSIRRGEIPFKGLCDWCGGIIGVGSDPPYCSDECEHEAECAGPIWEPANG